MTNTTPAQRELRQTHRTRLDCARALVDLEEEAFHADLPVLDWQISAAGLVGRPPAFATSPEHSEEAFHAWAAHLEQSSGGQIEVDAPVDRRNPTPVRVLSARARVPHPKASTGTVRVFLAAEIDLDEEEA